MKREGLARDIVRNIQDARKQLGCAITDTLKIRVEGDFPEEWTDYVCRETLSTIDAVPEPLTVVEIKDDETTVSIAIGK
jgi:isoleucyl-tRNA synthetase